MTTSAELTYIAERLGSDAQDDAKMVADLAADLAAEQGDEDFHLLDWLSNCTYEWTRLWEAANGDVGALSDVRREAHLDVLG